MKLLDVVREVRRHLEENGRVSLRMLRRQYELDDEALDELIEELVDVQRVARREENVLVWSAPPVPKTVVRTSSTPRAADQADTRKVVTIIFADLIGSTSLHERLDAESVTRLMERYYRAMRGAVETHGGTVVKLMGDGVMAAFGVPRVAEDDAIRAVRAGVAMQDAFRELAHKEFTAVGQLGLRVGINTGEVVVSADNTDVVGDPVNVAARLQTEAQDGQVVIGESTRRLVAALATLAPLGSVTLKGRAEAVKAYRVESLERPVGTTTAAFVGRDDELGRITAVYDAAIATPAARLAVLLGSPGLGKSRMIEEFARRLGDTASVITAQCHAEGGATFAPVAEALRELLGQAAHEPASPPLAHGVALGSSLAALSGLESEEQQPQPGDQPIARGTAPGASGGAAEDLHAAIEATVPSTDAERARIGAGISALLAGSPASPEETFFVIRRFLAARAAVKPVVLVIDDLQWAEPLLLDLVEHLVQWGSRVPLLVLVSARPELHDLRSSLVTPGGLVADVLTLSGLDAGAAMRLAASVIGAADLPASVAAKVLATSEGNPLFVGELVRMLVQEGGLTKDGDRWIPGVALAALEMPPTIQALLAARLERLRPEERSVLEHAAVVGRQFSRSAVAELLPRDVVDLDARLEALRRGELIERDSGWFLGEPGLRFHHLLIRDAAYRRLLKGTRAELHARFADWIATRASNAADHDETIGWHLEQAHQLLHELGPLDQVGHALGARAAQHLAAAGRRSLARDDLPVAADLLGRAVDRLDIDDAGRADLALDWCEALLSAGDVGTAAKAIDELGRFIEAPSDTTPVPLPGALPRADVLPPFQGYGSEDSNADGQQPQRGGQPIARGNAPGDGRAQAVGFPARLRAWHICFKGQLTVLTAPQGLQTAADAVAAAAEELAKLGDAAGEAKAHSVHATALARLGKVGACEAALDQALAAARRGSDHRRANAVLAVAPLAALWGPSPVTRASGRCLDVVRVLRITQGAPAVESVALSCQGVLEALRGRTEAARRMLASSRKMVEDLGIAHRLFEADAFAGRIAVMEDDTAGAEGLLRSAYEGLRDLGLGIDAARAGALLARTLLAQNRVDEAEALSHESEALAGDDLQAAIAWRGVRAEALAKRGEHVAAVELAQAAVAIASATDALLDHADARMALAAALRAARRGTEADAEQRRAIELWEAKGATLLTERVRSDRERAAPTVPAAAPIATPTAVRRRVRPNAATAMQSRFDAALAARAFDAIATQFREDHQEIHHPTGSAYGRDACIASLQRLFRSRDPQYEVEPLATVGEFLLLVRRRSSASGTASGPYDVGAYENEAIQLVEVDESGLCCRAEVFAADRLANAIARLYERYAELLPEGPERSRAAAMARSFGVMLTSPGDIDRIATVIAPDFESVDHRHLSTWSMRGGGAFLEHTRALREVANDIVIRAQDVLALGPSAVLVRRMHSGTERLGGGAYERPFLVIFVTQADGRLSRAEWFDAHREVEALTCFEELTTSVRHAGSLQAGIQEGGVDSRQKIAGMTERAERPARRPVRANAATAANSRLLEAFAARDAAATEAILGERMEAVDHHWHITYGRDGCLETLRRMMQGRDADLRAETIATLGEQLSLDRRSYTSSGGGGGRFDVGENSVEYWQLVEVDESGQIQRFEFFATDRLTDAITRLYERYAELLPGGPARERAAATARSVAVWNGPIDPERLATAMAASVENADHRNFGTWSARGPEEYLKHWRMQDELAAGWALRDDAVLAIEPNAFLVRRAYFGTVRSTGGAFENLLLALFVFGSDGLVTRTAIWEPDCEAEALARFDELVRRDPSVSPLGKGRIEEGFPSEPFANAASRTDSELFRCFNGRDWEGVLACVAPVMTFDERRRLVRNTCDRDVWLEQFRFLFDVPKSRFTSRLRATRGERLALSFHRFEGEVAEGGGPLAMEDHLALHEVDADGRIVGLVLFDLEDEDAAYAELDARFDAGEGAAHPALAARGQGRGALAARDWEAYVARTAPDFAYRDHRLLGWGSTARDVATFVRVMRSAFDLAPDARYREDHLRLSERGNLAQVTLLGTRDGGAFETPMLRVGEFDELGRIRAFDTYDLEDLDRARARLAEIASPAAPAAHFENAASRAWREVIEVWRQRDVERFAALHPPALRYRDHRRLFQLDLDREGFLAFTRPLLEMRSTSADLDLLATRGERLALMRFTLEMEDEVVGPSAIDSLLLIETGERGAITAYDRYEVDDQEAARAEIQARWECGEGAQFPTVAWMRDHGALVGRRDWDAVAALYSPAIVGHDHRLVGWGTLRGRTDFLQSLRSMEALSPDARMRGDHMRACPRGSIISSMWVGTRDGGPFESPFLVVSELDPDGKVVRIDFYDPHHFDRARARFEEIAAEPNPLAPFPTREGGMEPLLPSLPASGRDRGRGPLAALAKPNAAAAFLARTWAAFDVVDLEAATEALTSVRAFFAPDFVWEDRRPIVGLSGGLDLMLASARERLASGARHQRRTIIGTAGDRVAVGRILWAGGPPDGRFEVEFLTLHEVNEAGLCTALIFFDPDDERAAQREAWARWAAIDPVAAPWVELVNEFTDAWNGHDRARVRACFADDFVLEDHRHAGLGRIEGAEAYVDSIVVLWDLAPDQRLMFGWSWPVVERHGIVVTIRRQGTVPDGGPFETEHLALGLARNGRFTRIEFFEIDALDTALARFEELRPDPPSAGLRRTGPLRIPANAVTRVWDRWQAAYAVGDEVAIRASFDQSYRFEDRRRLFRMTVDVDGTVANFLHIFEGGWRSVRTLLATAGDRLALHHAVWTTGEADGISEVEMLAVDEVDSEGRFVWTALFDPDDRAAAEAELFERHAAGGRDGMPRGMTEYFRGVNGGDLARARTGLCDDFVLEDRRRTGMGRLEGGDAYIASVAVAYELTGELHVRPLYTAAIAPHGRVVMIRAAGTNTDGGAFESYCAALVLYRDERIATFEFFEPEDLDAALARFEEIGCSGVNR